MSIELRRSDSTAWMNNSGTPKSSSSELDLDRPNIEDYLPSGSTIQQEPHGKLFLYAFSFSLYCYLDIEYKIEMKKQFFSSLDLLENEVSVIILIYIHFFYEKPFSGMICSIFLLLCLRLQVLL